MTAIPSSWEKKYHKCLELEFSDPKYFRMHHLMVLTYMIQTGRYAPNYQPKFVGLLREFLKDPSQRPSQKIFQEITTEFSSDKRTDNLVGEEPTGIIEAGMSIMDVETETPKQYKTDIVKWAKAVLEKVS